MKKRCNFLAVTLLVIMGVQSLFAQDERKPWIFGIELNAVDFYPVGEDTPRGAYFDEFFNLTDHWNISIPKFTAYKYFSEQFSVSASASFNQIKKLKELGTPTGELPDNLRYLGIDGMLNYYFTSSKLKPFVAIGGGYTWVEEGHLDSSKIPGDKLIGAATVNGSLGFKYWFDDSIGLNLQTTYKHSFQDYLAQHWLHSVGLIFDLKIKEEEEEIEEEIDTDGDGVLDKDDECPEEPGLVMLKGCPDKDGDGIADKDDLCPDISGLRIHNGCLDTDGDGYPDNIDECPDIKGTNQGCPEEEEEPLYCFEDLEDMELYFAALKRDGKIEVDGLNFKIQLGAFKRPPKLGHFDFLKNMGNAKVTLEDGLTKFRVGEYSSLEATEVARLSVLEQGVEDAFVVAFIGNLRISMREAVDILCGKK